MQNPSDLPTRATRKTTRFGVRDAKYNAAGAMHRVAWALQNSKAIGKKCEKPWENLWFCSGEDRNRTFGCFTVFFQSSKGTKWVSSETTPFVTDCMRSRLDPRRSKHVAPALFCGHPGTFGNLRLPKRSLTQSGHDSRLQTEILWRTCTVIPGESHGFRLPLEDQQGRLQSY